MNWYVLRVAPQHEAIAERHLAEAGFTTFLPVTHLVRRRHRRSKVREVHGGVLLPGYLFVGFNEDEAPDWVRLAGIDPVLGVVGIRGEPLQFSPQDMLWVAVSSQRPVRFTNTPKSKRFRVGFQAPIVSGPYEGRTVRVIEAEGRVRELYELVVPR